jgi:hypothetical protein
MSSKGLLGFSVLLAFIAMPLALLLNPMLNQAPEPEFVGYKAEFIGQDVAEVGELVRFLAEGEIVRWECLPKSSDSESYGDNNENYVISFRSPGVYTVIAAIYVEGDLSIHSQAVTVEGPPTPVVVVPDPVVVVKINEELVGKVEGWAQKYKVSKDICVALSSNFETVVRMIEAEELVTPGQIINKTASLNSDLKLSEGLMAELQAYLTSQSDIGALKTVDQHIVVWNSIAKGLRNAAIN